MRVGHFLLQIISMDKLQLVQTALRSLANPSPERLSAFIAKKHGVLIEPRFVPLFVATLRDREHLHAARLAARATFEQAKIELPARAVVVASSKRTVEARRLAHDLMAAHGLHDWRFAFNRRKQSMGLCVYERRTVELSIHFVVRNADDEIRDTILHEIAHALVGPKHGHDTVWKRKCVEIGARPVRCGDAEMPEGRWQARCGGCGKQYDRHRRPKRQRGWFCKPCGPERGKLAWREQRRAG